MFTRASCPGLEHPVKGSLHLPRRAIAKKKQQGGRGGKRGKGGNGGKGGKGLLAGLVARARRVYGPAHEKYLSEENNRLLRKLAAKTAECELLREQLQDADNLYMVLSDRVDGAQSFMAESQQTPTAAPSDDEDVVSDDEDFLGAHPYGPESMQDPGEEPMEQDPTDVEEDLATYLAKPLV